MNDEPPTSCEITTYGVSISADRTNVAIYLGDADADKSFELTMPMDLAMYMAGTIQKLASPADARSATRPGART